MQIDKVVFYDGECGFCNRSILFILKHEKDHQLKFASLHSDFSKNILKSHHIDASNTDTLLFLNNGKILDRSTAALTICRHLKFPIGILSMFQIIPSFIRDSIYRIISKNRKKLKGISCIMLTKEQQNRFLDQ